MIDKIASKLSLYDILSMIIPGVTILLFFSRLFGCLWKIKPYFYPNETAAYFIILVLAYLIGLANLSLTAKMWNFFRNNPLLLYETLENTTKHQCYSPLTALTGSKKCSIGCLSDLVSYYAFTYIVILVVFFCLSNTLYSSFNEPNGALFIFISSIAYILICVIAIYALNKAYSSKIHEDTIVSEYYDAYYFVVQHRYCDDICLGKLRIFEEQE